MAREKDKLAAPPPLLDLGGQALKARLEEKLWRWERKLSIGEQPPGVHMYRP